MPGGPPLDHLVVHPCVQSADVSATPPDGSTENNRKIRFSAPLETFALCHYQVSRLPYLPIRGFYQMKVGRFASKDKTTQTSLHISEEELLDQNVCHSIPALP